MGVHCNVSCEVNLSKGGGGGEKVKFPCEICSKSLSSKGNMQQHVKEVHFGKKRYDIGDTPKHEDVKHNRNIEMFWVIKVRGMKTRILKIQEAEKWKIQEYGKSKRTHGK